MTREGWGNLSEGLLNAITIWQLVGDDTLIADFLCYAPVLSPDDRLFLAAWGQRKVRLPRGRPPLAGYLGDGPILAWDYKPDKAPLRLVIEVAADQVKRIISDRVEAGEPRRGQKEKAIEAAIAKWAPHVKMAPADFGEKLRTFINRSKRGR